MFYNLLLTVLKVRLYSKITMIQINQIGKYHRKDTLLDAKKGRTFVTPKNKEYQFDYRKEGRSYIFILIYDGKRMQIKETDYNRHSIDELLEIMK